MSLEEDLSAVGLDNVRAALALIRATLLTDHDAINTILGPLSRDDMIRVMGGLNGILMALAKLTFPSANNFEEFIVSMQKSVTNMEARTTPGESA